MNHLSQWYLDARRSNIDGCERKARRRPLTVCIAARCIDGSIFCAADRMVTVGDMEMESPVSKIFIITNSIFVMPSDDDASLHAEILADVHAAVSKRIADNPNVWIAVRDVVDLYIEIRNETKTKLAARTFLAPLGLTKETFLEKMATMEPCLVARISEDMVNHKLPCLSIIIAGLDTSGSHIYQVHDGESGCFDTIGYAAIGAGGRHANAHFMMSGQSYSTSIAETLWATYLAKKRSEVAPGVGEATDIAMIGPNLGGSVLLSTNLAITKQLESVYKKTQRMEEKARKTFSKEMVEYVETLSQDTAQITAQVSPAEIPKEESGAGS